MDVSEELFEELVADALDGLPDAVAELLDNVVVMVDDGSARGPLGLYEGHPRTEREGYGLMDMPDRITLYRLALGAACTSEQQLVDEVRITVVHEIGHHLGIDDRRLHELGWG